MNSPIPSESLPKQELYLESTLIKSKEILAKKFSCSPDDFSVVEVANELGQVDTYLVYNQQSGIELLRDDRKSMSFDDIVGEGVRTEMIVVDMDGLKIDTSKSMSLSVYKALCESLKSSNKELPDQLTSTLLTDSGFYLDYMGYPEPAVISVHTKNGKIESKTARSSSPSEGLFRPAVNVSDLSSNAPDIKLNSETQTADTVPRKTFIRKLLDLM